MLRSLDGSVDVGSRFPYIAPRIKFGYTELVDALNKAIDKQEEIAGIGCVTAERTVDTTDHELDFDKLMEECNGIVGDLYNEVTPEEWDRNWLPRITEITDKYLGTGKKVRDCTRAQVEQLQMVVVELRDMIA